MTFSQTSLCNFDEVIVNTQLDRFGRLREYYKLCDEKIIDSVIEIYYEAPTKPVDFKIVYREKEDTNDYLDFYSHHEYGIWIPIIFKGYSLMSIDKIREYRCLMRQKYQDAPKDIHYFIQLMENNGEEFRPQRQLNFFSSYDTFTRRIMNITIRWSFERVRARFDAVHKKKVAQSS